MAARRGKSQARRNQGNGGLPGWAWGVLGLLLGVGLFFAAPKLLKSDGDGFFRPRPNPDAQPEPVAIAEDDVAPEGDAAPRAAAKAPKKSADGADDAPEYDFYTLLPGKEVPLSDAELAATERAETQRAAKQAAVAAQASDTGATTPATPAATSPTQPALPQAVGTGDDSAAQPSAGASAPSAKPMSTAATPAADSTRYLLQAGAFQASGQAEELKAKIALLGLGARVESASLGGKTVYRVRMGPYGTASDLAEAKRKLASGGLPGLAIKVK